MCACQNGPMPDGFSDQAASLQMMAIARLTVVAKDVLYSAPRVRRQGQAGGDSVVLALLSLALARTLVPIRQGPPSPGGERNGNARASKPPGDLTLSLPSPPRSHHHLAITNHSAAVCTTVRSLSIRFRSARRRFERGIGGVLQGSNDARGGREGGLKRRGCAGRNGLRLRP